MLLQQILLLILLSEIYPYYIYNAETNQILSYPSLNNLPKGFKIIRAPKYLTKQINKPETRRQNCPKDEFICKDPYDISSTYQFECEYDSQCPRNYFCCPQKCFKHKVCSKGTSSWEPKIKRPSLEETAVDDRSEQCEKWSYPCTNPFPYSFSYRFKCESDIQCPEDYLCCQQNCFMHKICSKKLAVDQHVEELRKSIKTTTKAFFVTKDRDVEDEKTEETKYTSRATPEEPISEDDNTNTVEISSSSTEETTLHLAETSPSGDFSLDSNAIYPDLYYEYNGNDKNANNGSEEDIVDLS